MTADGEAEARTQRRVDFWLRHIRVIPLLTRLLGPAIDVYSRVRRPVQHRYFRLDKLSWQAYREGRDGEAKAIAEEWLDLNERLPRCFHYGNTIHDANQLLGLIALKSGDITAAKARLLAAGASPGSPQLNSFGPQMVLARELLIRGERDLVLQYLDLVAQFWTKNQPYLVGKPWYHTLKRETEKKIGRWKRDIRAGRMPKGANWESQPGEPLSRRAR